VELFRLLSGGLRYAATTGYYLTALQAEPTRYTATWNLDLSFIKRTNLTEKPNVEFRAEFFNPNNPRTSHEYVDGWIEKKAGAPKMCLVSD
jgi:hypothetical protein